MRQILCFATVLALAGCAPAGTNQPTINPPAVDTPNPVSAPSPTTAPNTTTAPNPVSAASVGPDGIQAGDLMPEVRLVNHRSGQAMTLSSLRGKPVLLNFWATWCGPCRDEIPKLNELAQKYPKLTIIGVNVAEDNETVSAFLKTQSTEYEVWLENKSGEFATDNTAKLLTAWEGRERGYSIPFTVIVDADGYAKRIISGFNERALENSVAALFAK
jgi:thiol-disulfide isomerase/thioredoxin